MNRTFLFQLSSCTAFFVGLSLWVAGAEAPAWVPVIGSEEPPVLVIVVDDARRVAGLRDAIDPERVVAESERAVALHEGRIVTASIEDASLLLNQAGWRDREIELFRVAKNTTQRRAQNARGAQSTSDLDAKIGELLSKEELSRSETLAVLEAMDRGPAF